mmetsp:Transcript_91515/g.284714  ORF Transcript_91515/g.284714 Transcript_91515/m.284714 type:complete len:340 (+) Transcript_91515:3-1022(+)
MLAAVLLLSGAVGLASFSEDAIAASRTGVDSLFSRWPLTTNVRNGTQRPEAAGRVAFLVRTCRPTDAMLGRIAQWALELGPEVDFFVSVDETTEAARSTAPRLQALCRERGLAEGRVRVHRYTEAELEAAYPALLELREKLPNGPLDIPGKSGLRSMAWMFHSEPLGHWLRWLERPGAYAFVWVLEDDVGCSGRMDELVAAYAAEPHDLISGRWISTPAPREPPQGPSFTGGWYWYYAITAAFEARVPPERRLITEEHVQRISMRLLEEVERWCRDGVSTVSEQLVPTVAYASGMMLRPLRDEHIGEPFHYETRLEEAEWDKILASAESPGRLYHALKF